jgi:hypothetical protein
VAAVVLRDPLSRSLGDLLRARVHPGPAQRGTEVHGRGFSARRDLGTEGGEDGSTSREMRPSTSSVCARSST